jgi:hypothetical protein
MTWLIERWTKLGGTREDQYILPLRPRKKPWSLDEPCSQFGIRTAFQKIREAAGVPYFRQYDCRVQAITKLLCDPKVSHEVSRQIAGHISQEMQHRYSIQLLDSKRAALDALEPASVRGDQAWRPEIDAPLSPAPLPMTPLPASIVNDAIQAEMARQADFSRQVAEAVKTQLAAMGLSTIAGAATAPANPRVLMFPEK